MGHPGWLRFRLGRSDREREAGARAGLWAVAWVLVPDTRRRTGVGALPLLWGEGRGTAGAHTTGSRGENCSRWIL
jgi:hypothetical protein